MIAEREWWTRARVRFLKEFNAGAVDPPVRRLFRPGEEVIMVQWGRAGREVRWDTWWTSMDIDGAHIAPASALEVLDVLEEVPPT